MKVIVLQSYAGYNDKGQIFSYSDGEETDMSEAEAKRLIAAGIVAAAPAVRVQKPPTSAKRSVKVK